MMLSRNGAQTVADFRLPDKVRRKINNLKSLQDAGIVAEPIMPKSEIYVAKTNRGDALVYPNSGRWQCRGKIGHGMGQLLRWLAQEGK